MKLPFVILFPTCQMRGQLQAPRRLDDLPRPMRKSQIAPETSIMLGEINQPGCGRVGTREGF